MDRATDGFPYDHQSVLEFPEPEQPAAIERTVEVADKYELKLLLLKIENFNLKVSQIQAQIGRDEAVLSQHKRELEVIYREKYDLSLEEAMKGLD